MNNLLTPYTDNGGYTGHGRRQSQRSGEGGGGGKGEGGGGAGGKGSEGEGGLGRLVAKSRQEQR